MRRNSGVIPRWVCPDLVRARCTRWPDIEGDNGQVTSTLDIEPEAAKALDEVIGSSHVTPPVLSP